MIFVYLLQKKYTHTVFSLHFQSFQNFKAVLNCLGSLLMVVVIDKNAVFLALPQTYLSQNFWQQSLGMSNSNNLPGNLRYTKIRDILLSNISLSSQSFSSSPPSHLTMATGVQTGVLVLNQRKLFSCRAVVRALRGEVLESDHGAKCLSSVSLVLNLVTFPSCYPPLVRSS